MESRHPKRCPLKARSPKWKEKIRENCLSRTREIRYQLLQTVRHAGKLDFNQKETAASALKQIVLDEQVKLRQSSSEDKQSSVLSNKDEALWEYEPSESLRELSNDEYEEILQEMQRLLYEDIEVQFKERDAALLEEYEKTCALEEESLAAAFDAHMKIKDEQDCGLLCPICRKGLLKQRPGLIHCESCEIQLDIQDDKVNMDNLRKRLSDVVEEHYSKGCKAQPRFFVDSQFDISALYIHCNICEAFDLVF